MLQRLHPSLWYFDSLGPSCGVSHCTGVKQYQAPADEHWLQQYHKSYNNFWLLPTLPPVYSLLQLLHPCSGGIPLLQHSSSQVATWFSSPERSASCLPSTAEHSYLQKHWQMETRVSSSCIQKRGLPLYSSSVTQDFYFSAWAKTTMPYQKARRTSPRSTGLPFQAVLLQRRASPHARKLKCKTTAAKKKRIKELIYICLVFNNHYQMSERVLCLQTTFQEENHKNKVILSH